MCNIILCWLVGCAEQGVGSVVTTPDGSGTQLPADVDADGDPATLDCDDDDPRVNHDLQEIPGNGLDDDCDPSSRDMPGVAPGFPNGVILSSEDSSWCWHSRVEAQVSDPDESASGLSVRWEWGSGPDDAYEEPAAVDALGQTGIDVPEDATVRLVVVDSDGHETLAERSDLDGLDCS